MKKVSVIVVTYNRKQLLIETINALLGQTYNNIDIYIIDNASTDGTKEHIENYILNKEVLYYNTEKNIGGAGGFNYGIKIASESKPDYYWLLDDDAIPKEDALEQIMENLPEHEFGYICSNVRWIDGTPCKMNIPQIHDQWIDDCNLLSIGLVRVEKATFVGFLVSHRMVLQIGLPIKDFFIWSDDANYSYRLGEMAPCYCNVKSIIIHKMKENVSSDIVKDNISRVSRYYYAYRNSFYNSKKYGRKMIYIKKMIKQCVSVLAHSDHKMRRLYYVMKGFISGIVFNPQIDYLQED